MCINQPIDKFNHCFHPLTKVETINGSVNIKDINIGDEVLTTNGYEKVLKVWNNGIKPLKSYLLEFDNVLVYLCCTNNHKFKTINGWKEIKDIKNGEILYLNKSITEKHITFTQEKDIFLKDVKDFMLLFGKQNISKKYLKDFTYITKIVIHLTMNCQTLSVLKSLSIYLNILKNVLKQIKNGQKSFIKKGLSQRRNGINQKRVVNGIKTTLLKYSKKELLFQKFVNYAIINMKQDIEEFQDFVQINAKQNIDYKAESIIASNNVKDAVKTLKLINIVEFPFATRNVEVYDLMVNNTHEYFANGILAHNCIDSIRYNHIAYNNSNINLVSEWE
jgi:intein/homing endonuclease